MCVGLCDRSGRQSDTVCLCVGLCDRSGHQSDTVCVLGFVTVLVVSLILYCVCVGFCDRSGRQSDTVCWAFMLQS